MTHVDLAEDEVFLDMLALAIYWADPVPEQAVGVARAVATLQAVDAELAALVADSFLDDDVVLFRADPMGQPTGRLVSFAADRLDVDVELQGVGAAAPGGGRFSGSSVVGTISPPAAVNIVLETTNGTAATRSDNLGRFHLEAPPGPCRLRIALPDTALLTPWITP